MRIQSDHAIFISDSDKKQFIFVVSRITSMKLITTFEINYQMYKSLEVNFYNFPDNLKDFIPSDSTFDNPKCILIVELHEEFYYKMLKAIYDKGRIDIVAGLALEFNNN